MVRTDMHYLAKSLVLMKGRPLKGPPGSSREPLNATEELYRTVRHTANVDAEELAAILCGYWPFEIEKTDDQQVIAGYHRVLCRIREAVREGVLPEYPTLREGALWAIEVGLPFVNQEQLRAAVGLLEPTADTHQIEAADRANKSKDVRPNPEWQAEADKVKQEDRASGRRRKKKGDVADLIIERLGLKESHAVVMKGFNYSGRTR